MWFIPCFAAGEAEVCEWCRWQRPVPWEEAVQGTRAWQVRWKRMEAWP